MPANALDILRLCAASSFLGEYALKFGHATGGNLSTVIDSGLISYRGDQRWKNHHVTVFTGGVTGLHRYVYSVDLGTGALEWQQPVAGGINAGEPYLLLREGPLSRWFDWMNETVKAIYYPREVYLRGVTNQYRYTLPTPISAGGWVEAAYRGPFPFSFDQSQPARIRWYRLNPTAIASDLHLVLSSPIDPSEQVVFLARVPYLQPTMSAYTFTRSTLVPFGETAPAELPAALIAAGTVWRCLREKVGNLTGEARLLWSQNRDDAARAYAQLLAENGVKAVAVNKLGWSQEW